MSFLEVAVYILIILALVGFGIFWLIMEWSYKHKVRIKELVKGRKIVRDFRAKPFTDNEGISWWKITGEKDKTKKLLPLPPEEAIEINYKGKKVAECYRTEFGEIIWLKEEGDVKNIEELESKLKKIPKDIDAIKDPQERKEATSRWREEERGRWYADKSVIAPYHAINTKQRMIYFNNVRKAEDRRNKFDWKQQIVPIVSIGVLAIVLIAGMVFWGDLAQPAIQANQQALELKQVDAEIVTILREIKTNQQNINNRLDGIENAPD